MTKRRTTPGNPPQQIHSPPELGQGTGAPAGHDPSTLTIDEVADQNTPTGQEGTGTLASPEAVALMFGEEAEDRDPGGGQVQNLASHAPGQAPVLDANGRTDYDAVKADLDPGAAPAGYEPSKAETAPPSLLVQSAPPDKEPSFQVVNISGNTPRTHAREDQDNNNQERHDDNLDHGENEGQDNDSPLDWEEIEREWSTGTVSATALARLHGCAISTITRRAKRYGWTQDLTQKVQARARHELIFGRLLDAEGQTGKNQGKNPHAQEQSIEKAASIQVQVVQRHRKDLSKLRALQAQLTDKAEAFFAVAGKNKGLVIDLATLQTAVQTVESLARTVSRVIPLERAAFNIDAKQGPASEAQAIERRVQAAADRKAASPDDPSAVQRATRALKAQADTRAINDKRRAAKLAGQGLGTTPPGIGPGKADDDG